MEKSVHPRNLSRLCITFITAGALVAGCGSLPQILTRIAKQIDMRYELDHGNLIVMPDTPYLHSYKIDYVNISREADGTISNTSQLGSGTTTGTSTTGNNSSLTIKGVSKNHFWDTLTKNITDILRETDKILPDGSSETVTEQSGGTDRIVTDRKNTTRKTGSETTPSQVTIQEGDSKIVTRRNTFREAASVIANPENGIITVRATSKQHEKVQEFIGQIMSSARRQVLIEATVVEVLLSDQYKQGIDWSLLQRNGTGFQLRQAGTAALPSANANNIFTLQYLNPTSRLGNLAASVSLLESFGTVKVLSSPKLSVMNNQTAMLRVVDNKVYFIVNSTTTPCSPAPCTPIITYTTTVNTVPVGFTMSVTPQINDSDTVLLNVRPSITRLLASVQDPTPGLTIPNAIPQTSTREMESVLKIDNNQIAVLGGLMEDRIDNFTDEIPGASRIPVAGELFKNRNDTSTKTELVIFLRPVVIKDASINGDFSPYRNMLPDQNFFKRAPGQESFGEPAGKH